MTTLYRDFKWISQSRREILHFQSLRETTKNRVEKIIAPLRFQSRLSVMPSSNIEKLTLCGDSVVPVKPLSTREALHSVGSSGVPDRVGMLGSTRTQSKSKQAILN